MSDLRSAAEQALFLLSWDEPGGKAIEILEVALEQPERTLNDEVIADLWRQSGGFHHHFAHAIERWLKGN